MAATSPLFSGVTLRLVSVGGDEANAGVEWAGTVLGERLAGADVLGGHAAEVLVAEAQRGAADLLVMGAYGHSPLRSLIVGSTTTAVVRGVGRAVLLFR